MKDGVKRPYKEVERDKPQIKKNIVDKSLSDEKKIQGINLTKSCLTEEQEAEIPVMVLRHTNS